MTERTYAATLHLLTGPWGSGKTTLVPHLVRLLPEVVVFDWDIVLPGLSAATGKDAPTDASTWDGLKAMWVAILEAVLAGGRDVLLSGPACPDDVAGSVLAAYPNRCAYLDCGDEVVVERLRGRGETKSAIGDELAMLAALRASPYKRFVVGERAPQIVAEDVAAWVLTRHPSGREASAPSPPKSRE